MGNDRLKRYAAVALVVAIPLLVPLLMPHGSATPVNMSECGSFRAVQTTDPTEFAIEGLSGRDGRPIHGGPGFADTEGARVCGLSDAPMSFHGRTRLPESANVWLLSTSDTGQFYLTPRVQIRAGEWVATDMRMGSNIVRLAFLEVAADVDRLYRARVEAGEWWELPGWPAGARELVTLDFSRPGKGS